MNVIKTRGDPLYKPLSIYVLDPLEYVALGLSVLKQRNGEARWEACHRAKRQHPDAQKIACVAYGALIYTALNPERTHLDMRPPEDWKIEAGVTPASMYEAKKQLQAEDPEWEEKTKARKDAFEAMNDATQ